MKKKTVRKPVTTKVGTKKQPAAPAAAPPDAVAELMAASARALGLMIDPAWEANVKFNLHLILRHAALVDEFRLPDDAEPAPIFHA
jgi:hypothetical protein